MHLVSTEYGRPKFGGRKEKFFYFIIAHSLQVCYFFNFLRMTDKGDFYMSEKLCEAYGIPKPDVMIVRGNKVRDIQANEYFFGLISN